MQLDLGGVYYEMAIRDHVKHDVLIRKAAELQRVDAELRRVEQLLQGGGPSPGPCRFLRRPRRPRARCSARGAARP